MTTESIKLLSATLSGTIRFKIRIHARKSSFISCDGIRCGPMTVSPRVIVVVDVDGVISVDVDGCAGGTGADGGDAGEVDVHGRVRFRAFRFIDGDDDGDDGDDDGNDDVMMVVMVVMGA